MSELRSVKINVLYGTEKNVFVLFIVFINGNTLVNKSVVVYMV